ncbi:ATP-binding protein [Porphyromonas levii]|uniref:ATP-binding protein n=1 Tax=Porphyromonas levii TaxID=28114 RepID=UPI001B8CC715|nr:ATP-binding protein [Porphyromonas levii]MBR8759252.1 hypothetical protein [Porphyromonas levii]
MMTIEQKQKVVSEMLKRRELFGGSDAKFATSLGINSAQYSRVKNGELEKVLSDQVWISIARKLNVQLREEAQWNIAKTPVFEFITGQLEMCQEESISAMICDLADIGKTVTARHYARTHKNAVLIDCSQVKTKRAFIKQIAREFGLDTDGKYADVYANLVYYIKTIEKPLIIMDEAGDLQYEAFLEIKSLWNATEGACGFYMMGADGLEAKFRRSIDNKKVGYTEIFRRFGKRYSKAVPEGEDKNKFLNANAQMIIKANAKPGADINKILRCIMDENGVPSITRIERELAKL